MFDSVAALNSPKTDRNLFAYLWQNNLPIEEEGEGKYKVRTDKLDAMDMLVISSYDSEYIHINGTYDYMYITIMEG